MIVHVTFELPSGEEDETSFDIPAYDTQGLSELFKDFCSENGFPADTVTGVTIVAAAETMEELQKIDL